MRLSQLIAAATCAFAFTAEPLCVHAQVAPSKEVGADTLVSVGGYRLHMNVRRGSGPITVIFEAGGGADLMSWASVPQLLAKRTDASIVAYDRAGLGASELGPLTLTPLEEVQALRRALESLDLPAPSVIVAHSYGALLALVHAETFAEDVRALVLVDPMNPRFIDGVGVDFLRNMAPTVNNPTTHRDYVAQRMSLSLRDLAADVQRAEPLLPTPMWILSAGQPWWGREDLDVMWAESHEAMAEVSDDRHLVVVPGVGHDIPAQDPGAIVTATLEAVAHARR